jgi:AmpD protein
VSFNDKAWHAGVSNYQGREKCNDFSIGIELEGTDDIPYTIEQYQQLSRLSHTLIGVYPELEDNIVGHCDIAPVRKTDPGAAFDWNFYRELLAE